MPETGYMRYFLTVFVVAFVVGCVGTAAGDGSGTVQPPLDNTTDIRVIIILDTPPALTTEDARNAAGAPARALSSATEDQPDQVISELQRLDAKEIRDLPMFNAVSCQVSSSELETVQDLPGVARVVPDRLIRLLDETVIDPQGSGNVLVQTVSPSDNGGGSGTAWGVDRIGAPAVWNYGINGTGINVSVIDSGINANHPDLAGKIIAWKDFVDNRSEPYDNHGHGTHVAGTIAGSGAEGTKTGVAPGANLIVVKVFNGEGYAFTSTVMEGFAWAADHGADIISFSGGSVDIDTVISGHDGTIGAGTTISHPVNVSAYHDNDTSFFPSWIAAKVSSPDLPLLNITLVRPDGSPVQPEPMAWLSPSATDWFMKYTDPSAPLVPGTWCLSVTRPGVLNNHLWWSGSGGILTNIMTTNGPIDLPNASPAHLQFSTHYDIDEQRGSGTVEIAPADTMIWQVLGTFTGKAASHEEQFNISSYAGRGVEIRFRYVTNGSSPATGWYLDDIRIPEAGYLDSAENGTLRWITPYWTIQPESSQYHIENVVVMYADNGTSMESSFADNITGQGVLPVIAAGNEGVWGGRTIAAPGTSLSAVTVGATVETGDAIADFSSRGPVGYGADARIKPDVAAPGINVKSTSWLGEYETRSGTSMATPHVAGTAALMLQADPSLTPGRIKEILSRTAVDLGEPGPDNDYGAGRLNASAAVFNVTGWDMIRGDFNNNGRTDIGDLTSVAYMSAGLAPEDGAADYNHNREIDAGDAAKIAWYYVGKISAL